MAQIITSHLVEAYSLCPRKAFLLRKGAEANPGPHDYELIVRDQAEANRDAHRVHLAEAGEVVPFGGLDDLAAGREVLVDAELMADGLQARCDFLTKINDASRLGRFSYAAVKVIGTCRASRPDTLGLAYQGLVLGEVQSRQPTAGTLILLGGRPCRVKLAGKYREVRRIVEILRAWADPLHLTFGHVVVEVQKPRGNSRAPDNDNGPG
jgi:predicted RecB family nuclease